jgi:NitT/TauT family transport system substrate-binding protein
MQAALHRGEIDASIHWLQHVVYGPANSAPVKAVMVLNNAPGVTVMVANRMKGEIRSGADFAGRRIAEGAGYATKSILTNYLAHREGLPLYSYTPVMTEVEGRREAVIKGLKRGDVDVMTFMEPMTSSLLETGMVSTLYDLTSGESTAKVLGSEWPAQSVFLTPEFIARNPEAVQKLVNALVRTMRFVNTHSAEQIVAKLPDGYFQGRDRAAEATRISSNMATFARGDYSLNSSAVKLVVDTTVAAPFDSSEEGHFRANSKKLVLNPGDLYDNRFVDKAMSEFP